MNYNFNKAYEILADLEGFNKGVHFNPTETTMTAYGVYRKYHQDWEGWEYIDSGDKPPPHLVESFYKEKFWNKCKCDKLPSGVDLVVFDFAVNSAPSDAITALQEVVGSYADGIIGSKTLTKVEEFLLEHPNLGIPYIISEVSSKRLEHMMVQPLEDKKAYGKGWGRRVCHILKESIDIGVPF